MSPAGQTTQHGAYKDMDDIMQRFKDALFIFGVLVAPSLITLAVLPYL